MPPGRRPSRDPRIPLTRERIVRAAIGLADREGIDVVTMRRLGQEVGVEAMSLYHHVRGKEELVTAMGDLLIDDIPAAAPQPDWQGAVREQALSGRATFRLHPWAPAVVLEARTVSAAYLRYIDHVTALFLAGGLSFQLAHTAIHVLGSRVLGFTGELLEARDLGPEVAGLADGSRAAAYPSIARTLGHIVHADDAEFAFALDLILEGLEVRRIAGSEPGPAQEAGGEP